MRYQVKHLRLGGILDQSFRIVTDNLRLFFSIVAFTLIPFQIVLGLLQERMQQNIAQGNPSTIELVLIMGISVVVGIPLSILVSSATIRAAGRVYLSREAGLRDSFGHATKRFWPFAATFVFVMFSILIGFLFCLLPAIVFAVMFSLAQPITVLESKWGPDAMKRSWQLMMSNLITGIALSVVLVFLVVEISLTAAIIPQVHLRIIATSIAQSFANIIQTTALVVFYYSCRCHDEHLDLWLLADRITVEDDPPAEDIELLPV